VRLASADQAQPARQRFRHALSLLVPLAVDGGVGGAAWFGLLVAALIVVLMQRERWRRAAAN
jgi:hypothetical protein